MSSTKLQCLVAVKRINGSERPLVAPMFTDIDAVIDRSGSMGSMWIQTRDGVRDFVDKQKEMVAQTGAPTYITITSFDNVAETMPGYKAARVGPNLPPVNYDCLVPRNTTRLIDTAVECLIAQGRRLTTLRRRLSKEVLSLEPKILQLFMLLTDGDDNESKLFEAKDLNKRLQKMRNDGGVAMFLAAGQDAVRVGGVYGFGAGHSMTYTAHGNQAACAMRAASDNLARAASGSQDTQFSGLQRTLSHAVSAPAGNRTSTTLVRTPGGIFRGVTLKRC